jgi:hypothetical protein
MQATHNENATTKESSSSSSWEAVAATQHADKAKRKEMNSAALLNANHTAVWT